MDWCSSTVRLESLGQQKVVPEMVNSRTQMDTTNKGKEDSMVEGSGASIETGFKASVGASTVHLNCLVRKMEVYMQMATKTPC